METFHEFLTTTKGIEYAISAVFLLGFPAYWGFMKEKPFQGLRRVIRDDIRFLQRLGYWSTIKTVAKVIGAPLLGLAYLVGLPIIFTFSLFYFVGKMVVVTERSGNQGG